MHLTFGPPIHLRPVCVRHHHGFIVGPVGYERTVIDQGWSRYVESAAAAWRRGEITLAELEDELDWRENQS